VKQDYQQVKEEKADSALWDQVKTLEHQMASMQKQHAKQLLSCQQETKALA